MKAWQLTRLAVPYLKAVVSAVERIQLDSYRIEHDFEEIKEALQAFLLYIQLAKQQYECLHDQQSGEGVDCQPDQH